MKNTLAWPVLMILIFPPITQASSGTEGASFLDIPVGARPAALGGAYSALASDAYAPVWNPGGLGFLERNQMAGQHVAYIGSIHYEFASFVHPLGKGRSLGASIQYLGSGDMSGTDIHGDPAAEFSAHYAAYSLAYGQSFGDKVSLGLTGKMIHAQLSDVVANAYAFDLGGMVQLTQQLRLAGVLTNIGTQLTFIDQKDSLPLALHIGASYASHSRFNVSAEGVYPQTGLASFHTGLEWVPMDPVALRIGYKTDTLKGLSPLAGLTTGIGLHVGDIDLSYAWVPLDDLGNTHYFSFLYRFGDTERNTMTLKKAANSNRGD